MAGSTDARTPTPVRAAGGVVCRYHGTGWEVAIVASGEPLEWRLPKGMCEEGESLEQTALREVQEETGLQAALGPELGSPEWNYEYGGRIYQKTTTFFLMFFRSGNFEDRDLEYSRAAWKNSSEAQQMLTFQSDQDIIRRAAAILENVDPVSSIWMQFLG